MSMHLASGWDGVPPAQAGWLGLVVILAMGVAVVFLYRSMNKHLRRVPQSFEARAREPVGPDDIPPDPADP